MSAPRRAFDPSLPLYAVWSLESPIYICVACIQVDGNEARVIGSRHWENKQLHFCFGDMLNTFPWRQYHTHVIPPDQDMVWQPLFERFEWYAEQAPSYKDTITLARQLFGTLKIDSVPRPWTDGQPNNDALSEALNQYAPREDTTHGGFIISPRHDLARFFSRTLELFASWQHAGNAKPGARGRAPNYSSYDRAVI